MTDTPRRANVADDVPPDPDVLEQRRAVGPDEPDEDPLETDEPLDPDEIEQRIDVLDDDDGYDRSG